MILSSIRIKTVTVLSCVVHNTFACCAASRCDNCELWRKYLHALSSLLGNTRKTTYIVQHGARRSFIVTSKTMHGLCQHCPSSAAQCGTRADLALPAHAVAAGRLQLPAFADMFGVWRRGDRTFRIVGRRMDDAGADPALPPLGNVRHRQRAAHDTSGCVLVSAVALWTLARSQRFVNATRSLSSAAQRQKKNPPCGCGPISAGGRGLRGRGDGGGASVDDVASAAGDPSSGNLTESSKFDSGVRQR
jgi:hypothetical protein